MEQSDIWAVVIATSGEKYVGRVFSNSDVPVDKVINDISRGLLNDISRGLLLKLTGALSFSDIKIPIPNPNNPGQIAINRSVNVAPIAFSMDPEKFSIYVRVSEISFFHEMSKTDREAHEQAVRDGYEMVMRARAQRSGIVAPGHH